MRTQHLKATSLLSALLASLLLASACNGGSGNVETTAGTDASTEAITESVTVKETDSETSAETDPETEAETDPDTEAGTHAPDEPIQPDEVAVAGPEIIEFDKADIDITGTKTEGRVSANGGLSYTTTGHKALGDYTFIINQNFTVNFNASDVTKADFNRFSICYVSTQPLKGTVTYTENGKQKTDNFFLEAGEHTFSCVTTSYLDGVKGKDITAMTFSTCNGKDADFALCLLKTYDYPVYTDTSEDTYYIQNDSYQLGIRLSWGGGINYLRDLKNTNAVKGVSNLINQADTGRLVQQSYYGTAAEGDYKAGVYNGSQWSYNPVQGGDVAQNHSRIIDIVVAEYSVYVKSQPMDWSLDGQITPSYMENSYTLFEDHIRVDNRFVDFSGMKHPYSHQELPAFYTLSCFDRFNWYDGSKGWTDDTLSYRDDLGFWGDGRFYDDCTFLIKESNRETWCAWTNSNADYGIGLYVPNADSYLAGRHAYNGSTDSKSGATNYVAPVNTKQLVSYEPLEYSYLMTTGSVEEIRATFKENKDFADNATLHENYQSRRVPDSDPSFTPVDKGSVLDLSDSANKNAVTPSNNADVTYDGGRKALKLTVNGDDPSVRVSFASLGTMSTAKYGTLVIEYMIPTTTQEENTRCDLFICAGSVTNATADCCVRKDLVKDGQFHTIEVDLSGYAWWTGNLNSIRFDFLDAAGVGDVVYVKTIGLK